MISVTLMDNRGKHKREIPLALAKKSPFLTHLLEMGGDIVFNVPEQIEVTVDTMRVYQTISGVDVYMFDIFMDCVNMVDIETLPTNIKEARKWVKQQHKLTSRLRHVFVPRRVHESPQRYYHRILCSQTRFDELISLADYFNLDGFMFAFLVLKAQWAVGNDPIATLKYFRGPVYSPK